ncbi:MAG TPA: FapA family protein [Gallionella sp.]|nr:FapA family protein [Gallionella sp.]
MQQDANLKFLSIHLDEKGRKVVASFTPEASVEPATPEAFTQAVEAAGFGGYSLYQVPIAQAIAKYNTGSAFEIAIGEALDGKLSVRIDPNMMAAYLSCTLPQGGAPVQRQDVLDEAAKRGITAALDLEAIDRTLRDGGDNVQIATGRSPVPAVDGKFEILFPSMKVRSPQLDEHGLANFRELGGIVTVEAGDKLMRIVAPVEGEPGETVTGKIIPVKPGKKVSFSSKLVGVAIDANDPNLLIATIPGSPVALKDTATVEPICIIKDVDLHTGNITFNGTIHVSHDVHVGMTLIATGDIYVDGTVENALLEAGGDIIVKGGIIGASELHANPNEKFHSAIRCDGSCTARFVQNVHITAGNGIFIHDLAMLSELTAGHQIVVGDENSRKGEIIGGSARATMLVKAKNIGSDSSVRTVVVVGADQRLHERLNNTIKDREAAEHKLADIIKLLELSLSHPGRIPPETIRTAEATRDALTVEIETLREVEAGLNQEISLADGAQVIVEKHVFAGAEIRIGLEHYTASELKEGGVFHISEDKLVFD